MQLASWTELGDAVLGVFGPRRRRWHRAAERLHAETRIASNAEAKALRERLEALLGEGAGAATVLVNAALARVIFELEPGRAPSEQEILELLARAERDCGLDDRSYRSDLPEHAADLEPLVRLAAELSADAAGFWIAVVGRALSAPVLPLEIDALALVSLFEGMPRLRRFADERLGRHASGLWLGMATALAQGFVQNPLAPLVDVVHRSLQGAERLARRAAWLEHESQLGEGFDGLAGHATEIDPRPVAVPPGPIEKYAELALAGSLGAFSLGFAATGSLADSSAALLGGLPRPARLGREAFAAVVARACAARRVVALDPSAFRRLELVDTLWMPAGLAATPEGEAVAAAARGAGLMIETGAAETALREEVRELQRAGRVVLSIAGPEAPSHAAADIAVGIVRGGRAPWDAHLLAGPGLADLVMLVRACAAARDVADQSVMLAEIGVGLGALAAFGQRLQWTTTSRVMTTLHLATLLSMSNGVRHALGLQLAPEPVVRSDVPWHALSTSEALARLGSSPVGLSQEQAGERRRSAESSVASPIGRWLGAFAEEFANPLTPVLAVGAGLSAAIGSVVDAGLIGAVAAVDAAIGAVQRVRAQTSIDGLRAERPRTVRVLRAGREEEVAADTLVPGDVVRLEAGEFVPADCRILAASDLEVDESSLTGESLPVAKTAAATDAAEIAERTSVLFEGSAIAAGSATAVVFAVGTATEARGLGSSGEAPKTGVEQRLERIVAASGPLALGGGVLTGAVGLFRGRPLADVLSTGVSLAVAAVPEGLPMLSTLAQVSAARRLSRQGILVRNPRAIEALGRATIVCLDKTGTLTEGRIALRVVWDRSDERSLEDLGSEGRDVLRAALRATPELPSGQKLPHGTDRALVRGARTAGIEPGAWLRRIELPFESARGFHAVWGVVEGRSLLCVKGSPESIADRCDRIGTLAGARPFDEAARLHVEGAARAMARRGLRVLAVAEADAAASEASDARVRELVFRGLLGLADPLRPTAAQAVSGLRRAGIRLAMLTGDHPITAESIGAELGLLNGTVLTGSQIDALDDAALAAAVTHTNVFARVAPRHKARLVQAFQSAGLAVAMTGDGANDAPAIRLADAGIALGTRCTTAARQAADVVVTDDRVETLVDAVLEGRALWASVRDAVAVLVGGNLGEVAFTVVADLISGRAPLSARQLLLLNLITDTAPSIVIATRPPVSIPPEQLLREGPEVSLGMPLARDVIWRAMVTGGGASAAWILARPLPSRSTVALIALIGTQLGQTIAAGGTSRSVMGASLGAFVATTAIVQTPGLSHFFGCQPVGPIGWGIAGSVSAAATGVSVLMPRLLPAIDPWLEDLVRRSEVLQRGADAVEAALRGRAVPAATPGGTS